MTNGNCCNIQTTNTQEDAFILQLTQNDKHLKIQWSSTTKNAAL